MNAPSIALLLLAGAVLSAVGSPRGRLVVPTRRAHLPRTTGAAVVTGAALVTVAAVVCREPGVATAIFVAAATIARRYRRRRASIRRRREGRAIASALEILVGELRAGAHPANALTVAAQDSEGCVGRTLLAAASRARLGGDVAAGLCSAARTSAAPATWERIATYWQLAAQHGLAMSTLVRAAHNDITSRQRFGDSINARLAGARASAAILGAMPVIGLLLGQLMGARPMSFLLGGAAGGSLLALGITLVCVGALWSDRIIDRVVSA